MTREEMKQFAEAIVEAQKRADSFSARASRVSTRATPSTPDDDFSMLDSDSNFDEEGYKKRKKYLEEILKTKKETINFSQDELRFEEEIYQSIGKQRDVLEARLREQIKNNEATEETVKQLKEVNKQLEKQTKYIESLETINQKFKNLKNSIVETGEAFTRSWLEPFMSLKGYTDYFKNVDKMRAEFAKATGAGRQFEGQVEKLQEKMTAYGKTNEQIYSSFKDLTTSLTNFSNENKTTQDRMVKSALILENLGQSSATTGKNVSTLNAVLGTTNDQAIELQEQLGNAAFKLGMTVTEINDKFISNMNRLSLYGQGAKDQFIRLQSFAKSTNMEVSSLLDMTEKLSTFEGSAEFAGRLNALAGKDLFDVTQLTMLEGQEKIDYIVGQLQDSGFDLDDPKMMRAVQQASGMDATTFRSMMNASLGKAADLEGKARGEMAKDPAAEAARKAKESLTSEEEKQAILQSKQNKLLNDWFPLWKNFQDAINDFATKMPSWTFAIGGAIMGILGFSGIVALFRTRGNLLGGLLGDKKPTVPGGDGTSPAGEKPKGILGKAKDILLGDKKECIAICDDSLKKLADMIGDGGDGGGLFSGDDGEGGRGRKRRGKRQKGRRTSRGPRRRGRGNLLASAGSTLAGMADIDSPEGIADAVSTGADVIGDISSSTPSGGFFSRAKGMFGKASSKIGGFLDKVNIFKIVGEKLSGGSLVLQRLLGKSLKFLGKASTLGTVLSLAYEAYQLMQLGKQPNMSAKDIGTQAISGIASMGGSVLGGILASLIPVPGIGILGGFLGGLGGEALANLLIDKKLLDPEPFGKSIIKIAGENGGEPKETGDLFSGGGRFYSGPEGSFKLSDSDIIRAGTKESFSNDGSSSEKEMKMMEEQNSLLREMIGAIKEGKNPFFSTNEFGTRNMRAY